MTRILIAALAAAALSGPALANDTLAASLGVDAGVFSAAELVELKAAKDDDNTLRVTQIIAKAAAGGFDGGRISTGTIGLNSALNDDESARVFGLTRGADTASGTTVSSRGFSAPEQLSRSVGVEPGTLTTAQLVQLKAAQADDNHIEVHRILSSVN